MTSYGSEKGSSLKGHLLHKIRVCAKFEISRFCRCLKNQEKTLLNFIVWVSIILLWYYYYFWKYCYCITPSKYNLVQTSKPNFLSEIHNSKPRDKCTAPEPPYADFSTLTQFSLKWERWHECAVQVKVDGLLIVLGRVSFGKLCVTCYLCFDMWSFILCYVMLKVGNSYELVADSVDGVFMLVECVYDICSRDQPPNHGSVHATSGHPSNLGIALQVTLLTSEPFTVRGPTRA